MFSNRGLAIYRTSRAKKWFYESIQLIIKENPIENVWGQLKQMLRQMYLRCRSFKFTTLLFEMLVRYQLFALPNLKEHDALSSITYDC